MNTDIHELFSQARAELAKIEGWHPDMGAILERLLDNTVFLLSAKRLPYLKERRDELDVEIKLVEKGILAGHRAASYSHQLLTINEARLAQGKRQITPVEFSSGLWNEEEQANG